jgi:hypothetical protein
MARKSVADGLRKGLQREDDALDARFAMADSALAQLKTIATVTATRFPSTPATAGVPAVDTNSTSSSTSRSSKAGSNVQVVRETLSMPVNERDLVDQLIALLRKRGLYEVTRSQLFRAGIAKLAALDPAELESAASVIKRGRPSRKINT